MGREEGSFRSSKGTGRVRAGEDQGCSRPGLKTHSTWLKTRTPCVWRLLLCTYGKKTGVSDRGQTKEESGAISLKNTLITYMSELA